LGQHKRDHMELQELYKENQRLKQELNKFKLILDQAPGPVFIIDKNSKLEYMNPEFTRITGYTEKDLLNKNINETLYKGKMPESRKNIRDSLMAGKSWQGELYALKKDGSYYWANTITAPYKDEKGGVDGFIVIQQDITRRKQMELALKEKEELYRTLIEKSLDGVAISMDEKILLANEAFCHLFGYTLKEIKEINPAKLISPKDRDRVLELYRKRIAGELGSMRYTAEMVHSSGREFTVDVNASSIIMDGQTASFVTIRDITTSTNLQGALARSEQKYRELTEMLPQSVYELDRDGNITYMNQTGLKKFGVNTSVFGTPAFNFIKADRHEAMRENMKKSIEENYYTPGNHYTAIRKDGTEFPVMIFAAPMMTDGKVTGTRGIILDMTEHEAMKNALQKSEDKYRDLIENAQDGIIITQDGLFKYVNQAFCEMMKYSVGELIGKNYIDYVSPDDHGKMGEYHKRRMAGENFQVMYRSKIIHKDGSYMHVEMNARTSNFEGRPAAFIIIRDISERVKNEEELRIAKEKLESLNKNLESKVKESSEKLIEANTQLIRLQKENLQSQFEVLRQQVNPHFLFNSLNVLTSLIKLEPDLAEQFTEYLSKVYRYVLENKDNDLVKLQTELEFLEAYIFLLNIRFMDKIKVNVNIEYHKADLLILPLAMQLLIENAIKHNAMSKKAPLVIDIFVDDNDVLNIINNLQERESYMASTGVGLKNIEHRYMLLEMPLPEFLKTQTQFIAKIPLKKIDQ
jgi:PAS domain S-box-containing protein